MRANNCRGDITIKVLDNTDATIRYSDGWRQEIANNKQYSNGSAHNSGTAGSTVLIPYVYS